MITNLLNALAQIQLNFANVDCSRNVFSIPQKIITTTFRTTSHPFQHHVCQTIKSQQVF